MAHATAGLKPLRGIVGASCAPFSCPRCSPSWRSRSSRPAPRAQNPWLKKRVLNIAHQGGEDEFPSNTLYAFQRSVRAGADMLELDVGVTRDGRSS